MEKNTSHDHGQSEADGRLPVQLKVLLAVIILSLLLLASKLAGIF